MLPWRKNVMEHHRLIFVKPYESFSKKAQLKVGLLGKARQGIKFRQDFSGHIALEKALKVGLFHLNRLALSKSVFKKSRAFAQMKSVNLCFSFVLLLCGAVHSTTNFIIFCFLIELLIL
jgi:hypothetical protein